MSLSPRPIAVLSDRPARAIRHPRRRGDGHHQHGTRRSTPDHRRGRHPPRRPRRPRRRPARPPRRHLPVPHRPACYHDLLAWARGLGEPVAWGVEGTGSYGAALVTAPAELREQLRGLSAAALVRTAATLAPRHQALSAEISSLTTELDRLTAKAAPQLVALFGVGQDSAGALLVAAGDNPG